MIELRPVRVVWRDRDQWRDLTGEVEAAGQVTMISENATARFIDFDRRRHIRRPLEGGNVLFGDGSWMPFQSASVTPCGVVLDHPQFLARSTRLRLVFAGLVDEWLSTPAGREVVASAVNKVPPVSPGIPTSPVPPTTARLGSGDRNRRTGPKRVTERPPRLPIPHRMRRLTDAEMAELVKSARSGPKGPSRAMQALWDLILQEVEGMSVAEGTASGRAWLVQNYAIADDQSQVLYHAFMSRRKAAASRRYGLLWLMWAPATYDDTEDGEGE